MSYMIIEDGCIVNVIVADADFSKQIGALPSYDGAKIGDRYNPPPANPDPDEDRDALLIDLDYRTTLLELGVI